MSLFQKTAVSNFRERKNVMEKLGNDWQLDNFNNTLSNKIVRHWKEILLQKVFFLKYTSQGEMVDVYATFNTSFNFGNTLWINFNLQVYIRLIITDFKQTTQSWIVSRKR